MAIGSFITSLAGFRVPFVFPWASLAYLLSLGFLDPFLNFAFPWAFTEFFGLPRPNCIIPHPWGSWACYQPFTFFAFITLDLPWLILTFSHHILPMVCFFFFLSFRAPLSTFASFRPICLFHGPVIHYFYSLGLMGFLSICQLFSVCDAWLLLSTWASKMAINRYPSHEYERSGCTICKLASFKRLQ